MKSAKFIFLFSVTTFSSIAQIPYHSFPTSNSQWSEAEVYQGIGAEFGRGYLYTLASDTVIEGKSFTLIGFNATFNDYGNLTYQLPGQIFGAIREDSSRKVWFRSFTNYLPYGGCSYTSEIPPDSDILLYNFSLNAGDTFIYHNGAYEYPVPLEKIDSVQLYTGEWHRRFRFDTACAASCTDSWIDGVGSSRGLFSTLCAPFFEGYCFLTCMNSADTSTYSILPVNIPFYFELTNDCNSVYTSNFEIINDVRALVYPNPAADILNARIDLLITRKISFEIINFMGKKILNKKISANENYSFLTNEIGPSGIYFYSFICEGRILSCGEIAIQ